MKHESPMFAKLCTVIRTSCWLCSINRDAELQFPGLHDRDLYEVLPSPIGEKPLNWKQSYKVEHLIDTAPAAGAVKAKLKILRWPSGNGTQ